MLRIPRLGKISRGIYLGPCSSEISEGLLESLCAATLAHSKVNGTRRSSRNSSVIYQRVIGLPVGCCFRNSPLIRLRALLLSSVAACKLYLLATIEHKRPPWPVSLGTRNVFLPAAINCQLYVYLYLTLW